MTCRPRIGWRRCSTLLGQGYRSVKLKARAWRDIIAQIAALDAAAPPGFTLEVDFNGQLIEPGRAITVLRELEQFERLAMFESPIPQETRRATAGFAATSPAPWRCISAHRR